MWAAAMALWDRESMLLSVDVEWHSYRASSVEVNGHPTMAVSRMAEPSLFLRGWEGIWGVFKREMKAVICHVSTVSQILMEWGSCFLSTWVFDGVNPSLCCQDYLTVRWLVYILTWDWQTWKPDGWHYSTFLQNSGGHLEQQHPSPCELWLDSSSGYAKYLCCSDAGIDQVKIYRVQQIAQISWKLVNILNVEKQRPRIIIRLLDDGKFNIFFWTFNQWDQNLQQIQVEVGSIKGFRRLN